MVGTKVTCWEHWSKHNHSIGTGCSSGCCNLYTTAGVEYILTRKLFFILYLRIKVLKNATKPAIKQICNSLLINHKSWHRKEEGMAHSYVKWGVSRQV